MQNLPSTRKEAKSIGSKFYEPKSLCKNGKISKRLTSTGHCYCDECTQSLRKKRRDCRAKKSEYYNLKSSEWKANNKEKVNESFRRYKSENKVSFCMRGFITYAMKRVRLKKIQSALLLTGYTVSDFKLDIESKFKIGMTWENYGEWHIDHIKPIKAFVDEGIADPSVINALENLQPLWATENFIKGSRYDQ